MKYSVAFAIAGLTISVAHAQGDLRQGGPGTTFSMPPVSGGTYDTGNLPQLKNNDSSILLSQDDAYVLTFGSGPHSVMIDTKTGKVTYSDPPDEAARAFWKAVQQTFPGSVAADDRSWHLLERQWNGGIAAVLHGLTKQECEFAQKRIEGLPATPEEIVAAKKVREESDAAWEKWKKDNSCKEPAPLVPRPGGLSIIGEGSTSGESYKAADGTCVRGNGFGDFTTIGQGPTSVYSAECFQ